MVSSELFDVEGDSADTTVAYHQALLDPDYNSDGDDPAPIWVYSQYIRALLDLKGTPGKDDRKVLADGVLRQLQTLALYREVKLAKEAARSTGKKQILNLYVLLFPGEARDNTGIKDLNDKVLGYKVNSAYIARRQELVRELFWNDQVTTGPRYVTVGQDYKTASIIAYEKSREEFAKDLITFDSKLRDELLQALDKAEQDPEGDAQVKEIKKLRKILQKNKKYRFDFLFGTEALDPASQPSEIDAVFLLVTQALKGAGIARFITKARLQKSRESRKIAGGTGARADKKKVDDRGKAFDLALYRRTSAAAEKIKAMMVKPYTGDTPRDYITIFIDTVWTTAFQTYRKVWFGNPDVIRDVRKRLVVAPNWKQGVKYTYGSQVELLELWLVALNMLDFVKDFLLAELRKELVTYHDTCYAAFKELRDFSSSITWDRLEKVLTRDLRMTNGRVLVQGNTSEYVFYSLASDAAQQIFFTMDVRDLGVELMAWYELSNEIITEDKLGGIKLMEETFASTEPVNLRRRVTYDAVVGVMKKYFDLLKQNDGRTAALKAFPKGLQSPAPITNFDACVQVLLGGDEVFVAAHPYFERYVANIVADLDKIQFKSPSHGRDIGSRFLNMRTGVAFSSADRAPGAAVTSGISQGQREKNQVAHEKAMKLSNGSAGALKYFERAQRRIERLIEMLENNEKKKKDAPAFTERLRKLGLMSMFARALRARAGLLSQAAYEEVRDLLEKGDICGAVKTKNVELVDFGGNVIDADRLCKIVTQLEADVRSKVGMDNYHMDGPPVTKMPKLAQIIIDFFWPKPKDDGSPDDEKQRAMT